MSTLLSTKDLQAKVARAASEKAAAAKAHAAAEAEKQALLERLSRRSGLADEQIIEKASHIVSRAVENSLTSVQIFRFPNHLCSDNGRAIGQVQAGWEKTPTSIPRSCSNSTSGNSSRVA